MQINKLKKQESEEGITLELVNSKGVTEKSSPVLFESVSFTYEGNVIKFFVNGKIMVNATEIAKPFGTSKEAKHWLKLQSANELLTELSKVRNLTLADLVIVRKGGVNPGTWFHEDVAIEFARWLSPQFGIWCNDRVKEILQGKITHYPGYMPPANCEEYLPYEFRRAGQNRTVNVTESAENHSGLYVNVTGADGNLYMISILKAIRDFIGEEIKGNSFTELRLAKKIEAARVLFPEDMKSLRNSDVSTNATS